MITVVGVSDKTAIHHSTEGKLGVRDIKDVLGVRLGAVWSRLDACWCNPCEYMAVESVIINITWS